MVKINGGQYLKIRSDMAYCENHLPKVYDGLMEDIIMPLVNKGKIPKKFRVNVGNPQRVPNGKGVKDYDAIAEELDTLTTVMLQREFSYDDVSEVLMSINNYIHQ